MKKILIMIALAFTFSSVMRAGENEGDVAFDRGVGKMNRMSHVLMNNLLLIGCGGMEGNIKNQE